MFKVFAIFADNKTKKNLPMPTDINTLYNYLMYIYCSIIFWFIKYCIACYLTNWHNVIF